MTTINDWENPLLVSRNKLQGHTYIFPYENELTALNRDLSTSPWVKELNGLWQFKIVPSPNSIPKEFYLPGYDIAGWGEIPVPSNWTMEGYDKPICTLV